MDDRKFFAGDLGTQHLQHHIEVEGAPSEVRGRLLAVLHQSAVRSPVPMTMVTLAADKEADPWLASPSFVLDPEWTVVVRTTEEQHRIDMAREVAVDNASKPGESL
jgi:hypothetical protein